MITDEIPSGEPQQSQQATQAWRDNSEELQERNKYHDPAVLKRYSITQKLRIKHSKKGMEAKALVLDDLLKRFANKALKGDQDLKDNQRTLHSSLKLPIRKPMSVGKRQIRVFSRTVDNILMRDGITHRNRREIMQSDDLVKKLGSVSIEQNSIQGSANGSCSTFADSSAGFVNTSLLEGDNCTIGNQEILDSRRFREYCTNIVNKSLNESLEKFLAELSRLQRNLYNRDNVKGRYKRRYYAGFKETERRLLLKKIKLVIIAPDLDKNKNNGELDNRAYRFIDSCKKHEIAVIFGLSRRKLGYLMLGKGFVSCVGVANYEALEEKLEDALTKVLEAKNEFKKLKGAPQKTVDVKNIITDDLLLSERVKILLKTLASF